jgi:hypothetical protein
VVAPTMSWFEYTRNDGQSLQCVADPGCLHRIPDSGSNNNNNERGVEKKISCLTFGFSHNFHKIKIILFLNR